MSNKYCSKGDLITIEGNQYRVLDINGSNAKLLGMFDVNPSQVFDIEESNVYEGSDLDTYLNTTWFESQSAAFQSAINDSFITTSAYKYYTEPETPNTPTYTYQYQYNWRDSEYENADRTDTVSEITRKVYALDFKDIYDYFGKDCITSNELTTLFFNQATVSKYVWLRSANSDHPYFAWRVDGYYGDFDLSYTSYTSGARPAFNIDLSKITWKEIEIKMFNNCSNCIDGGMHKLVFDKKPNNYYDKWVKKCKYQLALNYIKDYIDVNGDLQGDDNNIAKMNRMCIETLQELIDEIN